MVKHSLKKLLDKYPYFLDKNVTSNFYKFANVQNENFKGLYQAIFDVYEGFHLNKKLSVWKEQTSPYEYTVRFHADYPRIKNVKIYKNNNTIYIREYSNEDDESSFDYSYTHDTRNDLEFTEVADEDDEITVLTYEEQQLQDRLLVWRINKTTDDDTKQYTLNIKAKYPRFKKITITKNDTILYTRTYTNTTNETLFEYAYDNTFTPPEQEYDEEGNETETTILDDTFTITVETYNGDIITKILPEEEASYIPEDQFLIEVETYDEYIMRKGFPENDNLFIQDMDFWNDYIENIDNDDYDTSKKITHDPYDHDITLDYIGYLNNIPRKEYIEIDTLDEYYRSEPPFNNRRTEDDYHYMKRIMEYTLRLYDTPAPVLEIWKLYGLPLDEISMVNREHSLLKMFDITKHTYHVETKTHPCYPDKTYETLVVDGWVPERWEHKDQFFKDTNKLGTYFFVNANTVRPVKHKSVTFTFRILNSLAQDISGDYLIDIYLGDTPLYTNQSNCKQWVCPPEILDELEPNVFTFICKTTEKEIGRVNITINVRGCSDADFFVNESTGNDNNNGSKTAPFKTLKKALSKVTGVYDLIAINGAIHTTETLRVPETCTILGCNNASITNNITSKFFNVAQDKTLTVQDLTFHTHEKFTTMVEDVNFENKNITDETETAIMYSMDYGVKIYDTKEEVFIKNITLNNSTGLLEWTEITKANEIDDLLDYDGIITNLELTDDLYYTEYANTETLTKDYDKSYVYFSNRSDMLNATYQINNSLDNLINTGLLDYYEYGDEIIYDTKTHGLDEYQYQHITATQAGFTPRQASWLLGTLKLNIKILNPVVGQIIKLATNDGYTSSFKVNSINGENLTFKDATSASTATSYVYIQAVKGDTERVNVSLESMVTGNGFVHVGSNSQLFLSW